MRKDYSTCKDEQQFKMKYIKEELRNALNKVFCIETEETVKGFPDVMVVFPMGKNTGCHTYFYEFKISDKSGRIKFQPTQPAFYRANPELAVQIVAYNRNTDSVVTFLAEELFNKSSPFALSDRATVNLNMESAK